MIHSFLSLSVPLLSNTKSLKDPLRCYGVAEQLSGNERWFCPTCNKRQDAEKCTELWKLPPILIIQLQRFQFHERKNRWVKNNVVLKAEATVDLQEFERNSKTSAVYDVVCSTNHIGRNVEEGHYTATCYHAVKQCYYYFDDEEVEC